MDEKQGAKQSQMNLGHKKEAIAQMAQSEDAQRLMELLGQNGSVQEAATAAAGGNVSQLMGMVQRLMKSPEGAELVNRISAEAKKTGLG